MSPKGEEEEKDTTELAEIAQPGSVDSDNSSHESLEGLSSSEEDGQPPFKRAKGRIGEKYQFLSKEHEVDVVFVVGDAKERVMAHRGPLIAMSPVFASMFSHRWSQGVEDCACGEVLEVKLNMPIGMGIDLEGFTTFLKGIYSGELEKSLGMDVAIQVLKLGDMYDIPKVITTAEAAIESKLWHSNCVELAQATKLIYKSNIYQRAFDYLKRHFVSVVNVNGHLHMSEETWTVFLSCDVLHGDIDELSLFEGLLEWKNFDDVNRTTVFQTLVRLIRFPTMKAEQFTKYVVPAGVLSSQDTIDILCYFSQPGFQPKISRFNCAPRASVKIAKTSQELMAYLQAAADFGFSDSIQLLEGIYEISKGFLFTGRLILCGAGDGTILRGVRDPKKSKNHDPLRLLLLKESSQISHLKLQATSYENGKKSIVIDVHGKYCHLNNIVSEGCSVILRSRKNEVQNIIFSNVEGRPCVHLTARSENNQLYNISSTNSVIGVILEGKNNSLNFLSFQNVYTGVEIHGQHQIVKNMTFRKIPSDGRINAYFCIKMHGRNNLVSNVQCGGLVGEPRTYALVIRSEGDDDTEIPSYNFIRNVGPGRVVVIGSDQTLTNVDAADLLLVSGICHKLLECRAQSAIYHNVGVDEDEDVSAWYNSVKLDDCDFTLTYK